MPEELLAAAMTKILTGTANWSNREFARAWYPKVWEPGRDSHQQAGVPAPLFSCMRKRFLEVVARTGIESAY